jgi:hypothetical protein
MDIIGDEAWANYTNCTMFARTKSNFIYKLNKFRIYYGGQYGEGIGPKGNINTIKESMLQGKKYRTVVSICKQD